MTELAPLIERLFANFTPGATGVWVGVLMFAGWWLKEYRETRRLSMDDRQARRDGYAKQVEGLQTENRNLRADLVASEKKHDEYRRLCEQETDQLRDELREVRDEMTGMRRAMEARSVSAARALPAGALSDLAASAAERVAHIQEGRE